MNYLIDGHNLIAQIPGMSLDMLDDEEQLMRILIGFGEKQRGKLEVYFDRSPAGQAGNQNLGRVLAYFVAESSTADDAIKKRLIQLGKSAPSWTVVSSDHQVQAAAHEVHAKVKKSEDFARQLLASASNDKEVHPKEEQLLSQSEVDEWLQLFKQRKSTK